MTNLITFKSSKFDPKSEPKNPINPIAGHSVLVWLSKELITQYNIPDPDYEDWGWSSEVSANDSNYILGASADIEVDSPEIFTEWTVQIHKKRNFLDTILGRNKLDKEDLLTSAVLSKITSESTNTEVSFEAR